MMEYKKYALKTGNLYTIKTDKFRTANIEINFKCDIRNCNVTCQNLFQYKFFSILLKKFLWFSFGDDTLVILIHHYDIKYHLKLAK